MRTKEGRQSVRQQVGDILSQLKERYPHVAVIAEYDNDSPGIDAAIQVLGKPDLTRSTSEAAQDLTSELWEEKGIYVQVRTSQELWCRNSGDIVQDMGPLAPGQQPPRMIVVDFDKRGIMFVCYPSDGHTAHDFGEVRPLH